jgi:hypothetical protein
VYSESFAKQKNVFFRFRTKCFGVRYVFASLSTSQKHSAGERLVQIRDPQSAIPSSAFARVDHDFDPAISVLLFN